MQKIEEYISPSGQLMVCIAPEYNVVAASYGNLTDVTVDEYVNYIRKCGDLAQKFGLGKLFLDMTDVNNFSLPLRAAGVNNINELLLQKIPYFVLAITKSKNTFDNFATQTAMNMARPLSKKFLEGKMFSTREEALSWLKMYDVSPVSTANNTIL